MTNAEQLKVTGMAKKQHCIKEEQRQEPERGNIVVKLTRCHAAKQCES
jgi:hypothetical protein